MVGYDKEKETNILKSGIAGVFGGQITRALVCPIDVVKIRFQLQPGTVRSELKYNGLIQAVKTIWKEESIYGFYKGHVPAQLLSMVYGGVQFASFEYITKAANEIIPHSKDDHSVRSVVHFGCGCLSGAICTLTSQPFDVVRTRFAAQKEPKQYRTVTSAIKGMYVGEGLSSFFKGLTPALSQIIPYSGFTFCFNSLLQGLWRECSFNEGPVSHTICGGGAGLMSKCIVYPMDVVKKRLQVQGFSEATISEVVTYNGFRDCISTIKKQEGVRGFYKGLHVAAIKSTCTSALIFLTYECISDFIR
uniref:mitochondrial thiamine pyrophosphate carrier-like n=1 Tax=Ciona intestinalis TaxID=7719 RepID=UPI00006A4BD9|nr:mitochondrial thiamine pyrophosphate carrier-like [Ciona intestinalis]|eukprot:XP_026689747.1 mitochondrial thiamine pyrophosphate carrier-like [Ciona intestinalis]